MMRLLPWLACLAATSALADNLTPVTYRHSVECVLAHACAMKKPADINTWELLTKDMSLQEKAEGHWMADLSKLKTIGQKKATFHVQALQGAVHEINVRLVDSVSGSGMATGADTAAPPKTSPARKKKPKARATTKPCDCPATPRS